MAGVAMRVDSRDDDALGKSRSLLSIRPPLAAIRPARAWPAFAFLIPAAQQKDEPFAGLVKRLVERLALASFAQA
jgi:hypothetical protein